MMATFLCYSVLLLASPPCLLTVAYPAVLEPKDNETILKGLCTEYYLEFPIKVNTNSDPIRLILAQEVIRHYINTYDKRSQFEVYFDGTTAWINGSTSRDEGTTPWKNGSTSRDKLLGSVDDPKTILERRITSDLSLLFAEHKRLDINLDIPFHKEPQNLVKIGRGNLKNEYLIRAGVEPPTFDCNAIWSAIINSAGSLQYTLDPNATSLEFNNGMPHGRLKTFPTVEQSAEGFIYRYYSSVELTSDVSDTGRAFQLSDCRFLQIDMLTYAECRRGSDPQWHTVKIADSIYARNGRIGGAFSITPLYKAILTKLLK